MQIIFMFFLVRLNYVNIVKSFMEEIRIFISSADTENLAESKNKCFFHWEEKDKIKDYSQQCKQKMKFMPRKPSGTKPTNPPNSVTDLSTLKGSSKLVYVFIWSFMKTNQREGFLDIIFWLPFRIRGSKFYIEVERNKIHFPWLLTLYQGQEMYS